MNLGWSTNQEYYYNVLSCRVIVRHIIHHQGHLHEPNRGACSSPLVPVHLDPYDEDPQRQVSIQRSSSSHHSSVQTKQQSQPRLRNGQCGEQGN